MPVPPSSTLLPVIRLWLEEFGEDFREPPQYHALRLVIVHLRHRLCFRRLALSAEALLKRLQAEGRPPAPPSPPTPTPTPPR